MRVILFTFLCAAQLLAADLPVTGIAHVRYRVADMAKSREFYEKTLGLAAAFEQSGVVSFKLNDTQFIELTTAGNTGSASRLDHVAFESTDLYRLGIELNRRGVPVSPQRTTPEGNRGFTMQDAEGHAVQFVQYMPGSLQSADRGKHLPGASARIAAIGIPTQDRDRMLRFWTTRVGFAETGRGGPPNQPVRWIFVGPGLRLMLYEDQPSAEQFGGLHRITLEMRNPKAATMTDPDGGIIEIKELR
jgi:catechol 2,3-dioxygenase-like lactoylglutathione lyase family enzyme